MLFEEVVGDRHVFLIEPINAGLVATYQEYGRSPGIKGVDDPRFRSGMPLFLGGVLGIYWLEEAGDGDLVFVKLGGVLGPAARFRDVGRVFLVESGFAPPR